MSAGRPMPKGVLTREYGSFGIWWGLIRGMLLWAGEADIALNLNRVIEEDDDGIALEMFANALRRAFPPEVDAAMSTPELLQQFGKVDGLRVAFNGCGYEKDANIHSLGALLRRCENKIFLSDNPGHPFTLTRRKDQDANVWRWRIEDR